MWATCPDEAYRDGAKAVESATKACELGGWKDADHLDTLAAALADAGEFAEAVRRQEEALGLLTKGLYRSGRPCRQPVPGSSPETTTRGGSGAAESADGL